MAADKIFRIGVDVGRQQIDPLLLPPFQTLTNFDGLQAGQIPTASFSVRTDRPVSIIPCCMLDTSHTDTSILAIDPGESDASHRGIRSAFKSPTTPDVTEGITKAVEGALSQCDVPKDKIGGVMIGTTVCGNLGLCRLWARC